MGADTLNDTAGNDTGYGGAGADWVVDEIGNDVLHGGGGNDSFAGGAGLDRLNGAADNDTLDGGGENDVLIGDVGLDLLRGGLGNGTLDGGGADRFDFNATSEGVDTVLTFALGADKIDLSTVFAATGSVANAGNLAEFVQTSPATSGTDSFLSVDANGFVGGSSFVTIALVDNVTPAQLFDANNFVL